MEMHITRHEDSSLPLDRALAEGVAPLADHELLTLLLGTRSRKSTSNASQRALAFGGVEGLSRMSARALIEDAAFTPDHAGRLVAAFELGRRAAVLQAKPRHKVSSSNEVSAYVGAQLRPLDHEELWVLSLDGQNGVRSFRRVAQGGLHGCSVSARDILRAALTEAASAFVVCHNHPSGDPTPSPADVEMTRVLCEAAELVGLVCVDHIIVGRSSYSSMLDLGLLPG